MCAPPDAKPGLMASMPTGKTDTNPIGQATTSIAKSTNYALAAQAGGSPTKVASKGF